VWRLKLLEEHRTKAAAMKLSCDEVGGQAVQEREVTEIFGENHKGYP
jgi:hypothetical protein